MPDNRRAAYSVMRQAYQPPPYARGGYNDPHGMTLGDLMGQQGQFEAQHARESGNNWANSLSQVGQQVGQYFAARDEKREMAKREAATLQAIEGWDGRDPMELYKGISRVRGPADSLQYTNTVLALRKGPQKDPDKELERFGKIAQFMKDQPDEVIAQAWPSIRQSIGSTAAQLGLGDAEQWDPKFRPIVAKAGELWGPKQEKQKPFAVGGAVYDPETQQFKAAPEKPREPKTVETVDAQGRPITKSVTDEELAAGVPKYQAPREPKEGAHSWVIRDGQPTRVSEREIMPGDKPYQAPQNQRLTKDERSHFAAINYSLPKMDAFARYVKANPGNYGKWDAFRKGLSQAVPGLSDGEYASQEAFIGRLNAEIRHALFGASLTEGEQESARAFLIDKNDQPPAILAKLKEASARARSDMDYYSNLGFNVPGASGGAPPPGGGPVQVNSKAEYDKLPSGAIFVGPSGKTRRKP